MARRAVSRDNCYGGIGELFTSGWLRPFPPPRGGRTLGVPRRSGRIPHRWACTQISRGDTVIVPARRVHGFRNVGDGHMHVLAIFPNAEPDVRWEDPRYATSSWRSEND